jgi:hypothetical protein
MEHDDPQNVQQMVEELADDGTVEQRQEDHYYDLIQAAT